MKDISEAAAPAKIERKLLEKDVQKQCVDWARARGYWARKFSCSPSAACRTICSLAIDSTNWLESHLFRTRSSSHASSSAPARSRTDGTMSMSTQAQHDERAMRDRLVCVRVRQLREVQGDCDRVRARVCLTAPTCAPTRSTPLTGASRSGNCALWVDMGLGKTVSTLTAFADLQRDFEAKRMLVIAPKRVARRVWSDEVKEWSHLNHLSVSRIVGSEDECFDALRTKADIHTIGRERVAWLKAQFLDDNGRLKYRWPWDMVVVDESQVFQIPVESAWKSSRRATAFLSAIGGTFWHTIPEWVWRSLVPVLSAGQRRKAGKHGAFISGTMVYSSRRHVYEVEIITAGRPPDPRGDQGHGVVLERGGLLRPSADN